MFLKWRYKYVSEGWWDLGHLVRVCAHLQGGTDLKRGLALTCLCALLSCSPLVWWWRHDSKYLYRLWVCCQPERMVNIQSTCYLFILCGDFINISIMAFKKIVKIKPSKLIIVCKVDSLWTSVNNWMRMAMTDAVVFICTFIHQFTYQYIIFHLYVNCIIHL